MTDELSPNLTHASLFPANDYEQYRPALQAWSLGFNTSPTDHNDTRLIRAGIAFARAMPRDVLEAIIMTLGETP